MKFLKDAESAYIRYRVQSYVLEELARLGNPLTEQEFRYYMLHNLDRVLFCRVGLWDISWAVKTLAKLGYLSVVDERIVLTKEGVEALKSGVFQSLSNNAFFNYINYKNQYLCYIISALALLVSIISIIMSIY